MKTPLICLLVAFLAHQFTTHATAAVPELLSNIPGTDKLTASGGDSGNPHISADGRYVIFESRAENLVLHDGDGFADVFRFDRTENLLTLESRLKDGTDSRFGNSRLVGFSMDGERILFDTIDMAAFQDGSSRFREIAYKRDIGANESLSVYGALEAIDPQIEARSIELSPNGNLLFFAWPDAFGNILSQSFGGGETNLLFEARNTGIDDPFQSLAASDNGRYLGFATFATNQLPNDTNLTWDVVVFDVELEQFHPVSMNLDAMATANGPSTQPSLSADGSLVAFTSEASDLVAADVFPNSDVFLHNLTTQKTLLVSTNSSGVSTETARSASPALSADGGHLAFWSTATDLVAGDDNGLTDVFVRDNTTGNIRRISNHPDWQGRLIQGAPAPVITPNGAFVLFQAPGSGLFLFDRAADTTTLVSKDVVTDTPDLTPDGRYIVFSALPAAIDPEDSNAYRNIYMWDRVEDTYELISKRHADRPNLALTDSTTYFDNPNGIASKLVLATWGPQPGTRSYAIKDLDTGELEPINFGSVNGHPIDPLSVERPLISDDGNWVLYRLEMENLVDGNANEGLNLVLLDRENTTSIVVNEDSPVLRENAALISPLGTRIAFIDDEGGLRVFDVSNSVDFGPTPLLAGATIDQLAFTLDDALLIFHAENTEFSDGDEPYLYSINLATGQIEQLPGSRQVEAYAISPDRKTLFAPHFGFMDFSDPNQPVRTLYDESFYFALLPRTIDNQATRVMTEHGQNYLIWIINLTTGNPEWFPSQGNQHYAQEGSMHPDGRYALFVSNWTPNSPMVHIFNGNWSAYQNASLLDIDSQAMIALSRSPDDGEIANRIVRKATFTRDGGKTIFATAAANLSTKDFNGNSDVFTFDLSLPDSDNDDLPDDWELTYFGTLDRDGTEDFDGDGISDFDEYRSSTNPADGQSVFKAYPVSSLTQDSVTVNFRSVPGRRYRIEYKDDFNMPGWETLIAEFIADGYTSAVEDGTPVPNGNRFYRVIQLTE